MKFEFPGAAKAVTPSAIDIKQSTHCGIGSSDFIGV
jgi:hypothetical protein